MHAANAGQSALVLAEFADDPQILVQRQRTSEKTKLLWSRTDERGLQRRGRGIVGIDPAGACQRAGGFLGRTNEDRVVPRDDGCSEKSRRSRIRADKR